MPIHTIVPPWTHFSPDEEHARLQMVLGNNLRRWKAIEPVSLLFYRDRAGALTVDWILDPKAAEKEQAAAAKARATLVRQSCGPESLLGWASWRTYLVGVNKREPRPGILLRFGAREMKDRASVCYRPPGILNYLLNKVVWTDLGSALEPCGAGRPGGPQGSA